MKIFVNREMEVDSLQNLSQEMEYDYFPNLIDYTSWCYHRCIVDTEDTKDIAVSDILQLASEESADCIISFSVTDKEENYLEWLEAIEMLPGATVTVLDRPHATVYLCSFSTSPKL